MTPSFTTKTPKGVPDRWHEKPFRGCWVYRDLAGKSIGLVARFDVDGRDKEIVPFFKRNGGAMAPGGPPEPRPLYGLWTLAGAAPGDVAYICEGEKCCAALHGLGLPAVSSIGGAQAPLKSDWSPLQAFERVILLPDNDTPGEDYAHAVVGILARLPGARRVEVCRLPGLAEHGDCVDWLQQQLPSWDGFSPVPPESVEGLRDDLLVVVNKLAASVTCAAMAERVEVAVEPIRTLHRETDPAPPFPVVCLPKVLREAVEAICYSIQAPIPIVAQSVLAAVSLAVQGRADVRLDGRVHPLSCFFLSIAVSGERKSAVDRAALVPIRRREAQLSDIYRAEFPKYKNDLDSYESARRDCLRKKTFREKQIALDDLGPEPAAPLLPTLTAPDPTLEGLHKHLAVGWPSLGVFSAEGGSLLGGSGFSRENALKTLAGLSALWDGERVVRMRSLDGTSVLGCRRVAVHLLAQPAAVADLLGNGVARDQGLLSRCLSVWPESRQGTRPYREHDLSSDPRMMAYNDALGRLLDADLPVRQGTRSDLEPHILDVDTAAKPVWIRFHDLVEAKLKPGGELEPIAGFANKAPEHVLRLAGVLELVSDPGAWQVSKESIETGIRLVEWYLLEALRIRYSGMTDPDLALAEESLAWIRSHGPAVALADLYQRGPNAIRDATTARRIIQILEDAGAVERADAGPGLDGKPRRERWTVAA